MWLRLLFFVLAIIFPINISWAEDRFEEPPLLSAADVAPEAVLEGTQYAVDPSVSNDGLVNTYRVDSPLGTFSAVSTVALVKLATELEAVAAMIEVEESDTYTEALQESGENQLAGLKNLVADPVSSVSGAGRGLTSLFSRAGEAVFQSNPGETEDSRFKQLIGFSQAKREIAYKFKVDVYSTNTVLQEHLDRLAWADYSGGISISAALLPVGGPAKLVYSSSNVVRLLNEAIALTPPAELKKENRKKLTSLNIDPNLTDLFINNPYLSPRQQTYIVAAVEALNEVGAREVPLMVALQVKDGDQAVAITTLTIMQAAYNNKVKELEQLYTVQRIMGARDADGSYLLIVPADYLTWNAKLAGAVTAMEAVASNTSDASKQLWLLGAVSPTARLELEQRGWVIHEKIGKKIGVNETGLLE